MTFAFAKMHGLGNDFVVIDCISHPYDTAALVALAPTICDRHFGVGGDGLILVLPSETADFRMRIINSDGSEPEMCGNGVRCFAKFVFDQGLTKKTGLAVETLAGVIKPVLHVTNGAVTAVRVDMGEPRLERAEIPMLGPAGEVVSEALDIQGRTFAVTAVSMGNPHAIVFVDDVKSFPVEKIGPMIEHHPAFPKKTNVEFVHVVRNDYMEMRVWERGAGVTLACGTGACATVVAAVLTGNADRTATVELPGGALQITWDENDNHVYMTGPAALVFDGVWRGE
jgi:diaminopimelate epimerase